MIHVYVQINKSKRIRTVIKIECTQIHVLHNLLPSSLARRQYHKTVNTPKNIRFQVVLISNTIIPVSRQPRTMVEKMLVI